MSQRPAWPEIPVRAPPRYVAVPSRMMIEQAASSKPITPPPF
jgi:hypothetical protein